MDPGHLSEWNGICLAFSLDLRFFLCPLLLGKVETPRESWSLEDGGMIAEGKLPHPSHFLKQNKRKTLVHKKGKKQSGEQFQWLFTRKGPFTLGMCLPFNFLLWAPEGVCKCAIGIPLQPWGMWALSQQVLQVVRCATCMLSFPANCPAANLHEMGEAKCWAGKALTQVLGDHHF